MSTRTKGLAVLLRRTQWLLGDLAFHVGAGDLQTRDLNDACTALEEVVRMLREQRSSTQDSAREQVPPLRTRRHAPDDARRI